MSKLNDSIIDAISKVRYESSDIIHTSIGESISEYIRSLTVNVIENDTSSYTYTWKITGSIKLSTPSDFDSWMKSIEGGIRSSFYLFSEDQYHSPAGNQLVFPNYEIQYNQMNLYSCHMENWENPHIKVMGIIGDWIIDSLMDGSNQSIIDSTGYGTWKITGINFV